jgi:hypothetical protein
MLQVSLAVAAMPQVSLEVAAMLQASPVVVLE